MGNDSAVSHLHWTTDGWRDVWSSSGNLRCIDTTREITDIYCHYFVNKVEVPRHMIENLSEANQPGCKG